MAKEKREYIMLVCSECNEINYHTSRGKAKNKLELKKFCPHDRKHTLHKEKKRK